MNFDPFLPWSARLEELLLDSRTRSLTAAERTELNNLLRLHPGARAAAAQYLFDDSAIMDHLREAQAECLFKEEGAAIAKISERGSTRWRSTWLQWRPMAAAAAGLVFGMFCTSVVRAITSAHAPAVIQRVLPVANANFEDTMNPAPDGVPVKYGVWSGDFAEIAEAQQGIQPREGRHMMRFLRSDSSVSSVPDASPAGNLYQVVNLRPYQKEFIDGQARLDWSAWFNWVPGHDEQGMTFATNVWTFSGDTAVLPTNWKDHLYLETAKSGHKLVLNEALAGWQQIKGTMIIPPDTDFLVIELKAIPPPLTPGAAPYHFTGCFADDVQLTLQTGSRVEPVASNRP